VTVGEEYVLDWVLERKGVSDLTKSIQDDRYSSQKVKMQASGLRLPMYLVEGDLSLASAKGARTALFETDICAGELP
jgi:ERCC4-type nuclease